jgi:hypothetical protein
MDAITLIKHWWRELLILVLGGALGWAVYFRAPEVVTRVETKTVEVEKKVVEYKDRIVYRDRVRTRTITKTTPAGTKTVIVEREENNEQSRTVAATEGTERVRSEQVSARVETKPSRPSYVLLGSYGVRDREYNVGVGVRLGSFPIYATVTNPHNRLAPAVGVIVEIP